MKFGALVAVSILAVNPFGWDWYGPLRFALISTIGFLAIAISLGAGDSRSQPLPRWSVLGWVLLIFGMTISTVLSSDRWIALIGTPERHFGLITWLLLVGLFAVGSLYPNSIADHIRTSAVITTAAAGLWAILEAFDVGWFETAFADNRVGGPLGQPAFLGAAMVLVIPLCVSLLVDTSAGRVARMLGGSSAVLGLVALGLSQSRAAWVGFAIASLLLIVRRRQLATGIALVVVVFIIGLTTPLGARAATLTDLDDGVVAGRIDEWQVGVRAATDTPTFGITGHGPEGYRTVFGQHVDADYVTTYGRDVITDRSHNGILDVILSGGLISGVGLMLLQVGLGVTALQRMRADNPFDRALAVAVLAYGIQQLFLFPLAELDPILWLLSGVLVARRPVRVTTAPPLFRNVSGAKRVAMSGAGLLAALSAIAGLSDVAADRAIHTAISAETPAVALDAADTARQRRPDSIRYDFIAARIAAEPATLEGFGASLERLDAGLALSPVDPAFLAERAAVLLEIARRSNEPKDLEVALNAYAELDRTDPLNPRTQTDHGIALAIDGQIDAAITKFDLAASLQPTSIEPLLNKAIVELEAGRLENGSQTLDRVEVLAPSNATAQSLRREFLSE